MQFNARTSEMLSAALGFLRWQMMSETGKNTLQPSDSYQMACAVVCVPDFNLFELFDDKGV